MICGDEEDFPRKQEDVQRDQCVTMTKRDFRRYFGKQTQRCHIIVAVLAFISLVLTLTGSSQIAAVRRWHMVCPLTQLHNCERCNSNDRFAVGSLKLSGESNINNSLPGTTGTGILDRLRAALLTYGSINDAADRVLRANGPVQGLETECGWNASTSTVINPGCGLRNLQFNNSNPVAAMQHELAAASVHIVVPTTRDLDFLDAWCAQLQPYEFIILQDGDPKRQLKIPGWVKYQLYNRDDIDRILGRDRSWIISANDASIRNFGFLISNRTYIYTIDDDCLPAEVIEAGATRKHQVDAMVQHLRNLATPAIPFFFNTLYDPYAPGSDFVRGYPYSLRGGVPTVVSHGLWLDVPDYDAPTQLLKAKERNQRYVDATITVPYKVLYPMSSVNVAFDRKLIGPAFMQGLMGDGQPWARYGDMFAGWASKVCADHLGFGVKSGAPYIWHNRTSNPFTNLQKEYTGLWWQEDMIRFMSTVQLDPNVANAEECYVQLSHLIEERFAAVHPYFTRLATAMRVWIELWKEAQSGHLQLVPSRSSSVAEVVSHNSGRVAVFTIVRNEPFYLPIWMRYYKQYFNAADIFVLDNGSDDASTSGLDVEVHSAPTDLYCDHFVLLQLVQNFTEYLLHTRGYSRVLFTEVDEIVVPDPAKYPEGLRQYIQKFVADKRGCAKVMGYHIWHNVSAEAAYNPAVPILAQRRYYRRDQGYDKPLLVDKALQWAVGFHNAREPVPQDVDLKMFHLRFLDYASAKKRQEWKVQQKFNEAQAKIGMSAHAHYVGKEYEDFYWKDGVGSEHIPGHWTRPPAF